MKLKEVISSSLYAVGYKLKEVISSSLYAVGYNKNKMELTVEFVSGGTYKYRNVQPDVYKSLMAADSHGEFFCQTIKGCYDFEKLN